MSEQIKTLNDYMLHISIGVIIVISSAMFYAGYNLNDLTRTVKDLKETSVDKNTMIIYEMRINSLEKDRDNANVSLMNIEKFMNELSITLKLSDIDFKTSFNNI